MERYRLVGCVPHQRGNHFRERGDVADAVKELVAITMSPARTDQLTLRPASHRLPRLLVGAVLTTRQR